MLIRFSVPKKNMGTIYLQKQMSSTYKGKRYYKFVVVLPRELIQQLDWKEGEELIPEPKGKRLTLEPIFYK